MENFYLIDYIKKNFDIPEDILDSLKYTLDQSIYYYGNQFKFPKEKVFNFKWALKTASRDLACECDFLLRALLKNTQAGKKGGIVSNSYFSVNEELKKIGYDVHKPFWSHGFGRSAMSDMRLYREFQALKGTIAKGDFIDVVSEKFIKKIKGFKKNLADYYLTNKFSALIVPNDMTFFENISIQAFKEIGKPSFVFIHGLPSKYDTIDENRTDYLIVWGDSIRKNYINAGLPENKIFVSGHPYYKEFRPCGLKFDTADVLVITKGTYGVQLGKGAVLHDRGNSVLYLYSIQKVLKKFGVKSVRLRAHPGENPEWYHKFIDRDFFKLDNESLDRSLGRSTLVIGSTSTVFVEAIYYGVNYLVYEPCVDNIDLLNFRPAPPFDGENKKVPIANNEDRLSQLLTDKVKIDASVFNNYIKTPFDMSFIKRLIEDR